MARLNPNRPLEKTEFVDHIQARLEFIIYCLILSGHHENRKYTLVEHLLKNISYPVSGTSTDFIGFNFVIMLILR